ncbi:2-keto-4-pentenoate hydratase [Ramlibacter sp. G-1-2-2]|uniref:2-keto-4-pentenoate hydratase n=1 Tax=Ramlibacter agri TaxID=2728837 RepID=A0A848GVH1_9BURK|nr:2-keto-4-pentenoate hydratase [Ramlibacter agri]
MSPVVAAVCEARRSRQPVPAAPLAGLLPDAEAAYAVQDQVARELGWFAPGVPRHWKSGGPSREAVLTHAPMPDAGIWASPARAGAFHLNLRQVEAEVALRLARDVTPAQAAALTHEQAASLVDAMTVAIELVDSRWSDVRQAPALLKLADQQSHGAFVFGAWQPFVARDWAQQDCVVRIGAGAPQAFRGTHTLGDPTWLLPTWLRHVSRHGATVPAGTVVTTGTWCGLLPAQAGDRVHVAFEGIGEAEVQL